MEPKQSNRSDKLCTGRLFFSSFKGKFIMLDKTAGAMERPKGMALN